MKYNLTPKGHKTVCKYRQFMASQKNRGLFEVPIAIAPSIKDSLWVADLFLGHTKRLTWFMVFYEAICIRTRKENKSPKYKANFVLA